jgi:ribosome recycling factor
MSTELDSILKAGYDAMDKSLEHLNDELAKVRAGRANPNLVTDLLIDYYGSPTPLATIANVQTSDARTISIQPWEKKMLAAIERAIFEANLGITPMNNGDVILLTIPPLTEERRIALVKNCKAVGEDAKVSVRTIRQKLMEQIKKEVKNGLPEDTGKRKEAEVQKFVEEHTEKVNKYVDTKEKEIMKV